MIDFRYHLVSLISVFLALAVGIVLGAGPLKAPISESLQEQVDGLRTDRDNLRTELDTANGDIGKLDSYISALAPELLNGTLDGRTVTIVRAPTADQDQVKTLTERFADAGATTVDGGALTNTTLAQEGRDQLLSELRELDKNLPDDPTQALQTALARAWSVGTEKSPYSAELASQVTDSFRGAGRLDGGNVENTNLVVYVGGPETGTQADQLEPTSEATADPQSENRHLELVNQLTQLIPTVAAGTSGNAENGLVRELRNGDTDASTVDGIELSAGAVITVMAAQSLLETHAAGDYGFADSAEAILPETQPTPKPTQS